MNLLIQMYGHYSVRYFCELFGKSRQAYYELGNAFEEQALEAALVLKLVKEIRADLPRIGVSKLHFMLQDKLLAHDIKLGRDGLYRLLGQHGYLIRKRRRKPYTIDSDHPYKKYPNLIRDLILTRAGQLWVSDITYLRLPKGFAYLSIITDAYSHKIVGYKLHPTLHSQGVLNALNMAASGNKRQDGAIHHSDRGSQYCCGDYVRMLQHYGLKISMTENGDPYENAIAERINGILKDEFLLDRTFTSMAEMYAAVDKGIAAYNHLRPHASCDYKTPVEAHDGTGPLAKRWRDSKYSRNTKEVPAGGFRSAV